MKSKLSISQRIICSITPQRNLAATRDREQAASHFLQFIVHLNIQITAAPWQAWEKAVVWGAVGWGWEMPWSSPAEGDFQVCVKKEKIEWRERVRKLLACRWPRNISRLVRTVAGSEGISSFLKRGYAFAGELCPLFSKYLCRVEWGLLLFHSCLWATRV